jgi:hypothetical protein
MPYYNAGDYYGRGDYYQAGGIFGSIGKFIGGIARKAVSFIPGVGPAIGTALEIRNKLREHGVSLPVAGGPTGAATVAEHAEQLMFGGGGAPPMIAPPAPVGVMAPGGGTAMTTFGGLPLGPYGFMRHRATHPNKSTYVTRGGGTSKYPQQLLVHPKGTELVTSRRLNVANPRALRRALRRAAGFVKLARRAHVKLASFHGRGAKKKKR